MNLVGKILTVLIAVLSLIFMVFAVAVNTTHTNWRDAAMKLQDQLKNEEKGKKELQNQLERLVAERDAERQAARNAAAALKTEADTLRADNANKEKDLADLRKNNGQYLEAMKATQVVASNMRAELVQVRKDLADAVKQREDTFKKIVEATDELHQTANELKTLRDKNVTLVQDLQKYKDLALNLNIGNVDAFLQKNAPEVTPGRVLAVTDGGLIEISLGADAGLRKGHHLEVYRTGASGGVYLGRVEVVEAIPEKSVCRILPNYRKGAIQKGDYVASRF